MVATLVSPVADSLVVADVSLSQETIECKDYFCTYPSFLHLSIVAKASSAAHLGAYIRFLGYLRFSFLMQAHLSTY